MSSCHQSVMYLTRLCKSYTQDDVCFSIEKSTELIPVIFRVLFILNLRPWELLFILSFQIVQWPLGPVNSTTYASSNLSSTLNLSHCLMSGSLQT